MSAFATADDVREALQDAELKGSTTTALVESRLKAASRRFASASNGWFYDSGGAAPLATTVSTATDVRRDVPAGPHARRGQTTVDDDIHYPVTRDGPFAKIRLPHLYVKSLSKLAVRDRGGGVEDWVGSPSFQVGRDEDYYLQRDGTEQYGDTYLYLRASSIGPRRDYTDILTLSYDYGLDWQTEEWHDVRTGIAHLVAADLKDDSDLVAQIPDNGSLVGVQTQHDNLMEVARSYLDPYLPSHTVR